MISFSGFSLGIYKRTTPDSIKEISFTFTKNSSLEERRTEIESQIKIALIKAAIRDDEDD